MAGRVIASHYAERLDRIIAARAPLRSAPSGDAPVIRELKPGERFAMLDDSLGWAWGYAGEEQRVGYVSSDALTVPADRHPGLDPGTMNTIV